MWDKTVMSFEQMKEAIWNMGVEAEEKGQEITQAMRFRTIAQAQAEITWEIAYKEGIRKVVEMIERFDVEDEMKDDDFEEWENLKKENGL